MYIYDLHTNNILDSKQYGFREGISTDNAVMKLTMYSSLLTKKCSWRNFDCVDYEFLKFSIALLHSV
jgi:hypothetical protein